MEEFPAIFLNFQQKTPLTEQIRKELFRLIEQHALAPGDLLPTVRQLAAKLGVNFNTVARAYRALDAAGMISTRQGRGTYVIESSIASQPEQQSRQAVVQKRIEQFLKEAERDGLSRREIALALLAATQPAHKRKKGQTRYRFAGRKNTRRETRAKPYAPDTRGKNARVSWRKPRRAALFHVKQTGRKRSTEEA